MSRKTEQATLQPSQIRLLSAAELDMVSGGNKARVYKMPDGREVTIGCTQKPPKGGKLVG